MKIKEESKILALAENFYLNALDTNELLITMKNYLIAIELKKLDFDQLIAFLGSLSGHIKAEMVISETPQFISKLEKDYQNRIAITNGAKT